MPVRDLDRKPGAGLAELPLVLQVHLHERGHVKALRMREVQLAGRAHPIGVREHVVVRLAPRCITYFGHHRLDRFAIGIKAVEQIQRAEVVSKTAQAGQQPNRSCRAVTGSLVDQVAHRVDQRRLPSVEMVRASERQGCEAGDSQDPVFEQHGQFVQIQVDHVQPVAEPMFLRHASSMADVAYVEATVHESKSLPKHAPTAKALLTPSS